jgi:hypothetical protein
MEPVANHRIIGWREVEEPDGHFAGLEIAARHDRRAHRIVSEPVGARVPRVRLAGALAHHRVRRLEGDAPAFLLQRDRGRDLDKKNGGDRDAREGACEKRRMEPDQDRNEEADHQGLGKTLQRRAVQRATQRTWPHEGHHRDDGPQHLALAARDHTRHRCLRRITAAPVVDIFNHDLTCHPSATRALIPAVSS